MNIKEILGIIQSTKDNITPECDWDVASQAYYFKNVDNIREKIILLESTNLFKDEIEKIRNSALFKSGKDTVKINHEETTYLDKVFRDFENLLQNVYLSLDSVTNDAKEHSIYVKLPSSTDLEDLSKHTSALNKIFSQVIYDEEINGKLEIVNVFNGSIWIEIFVGSASAVALIGGMVWSSCVIYKKMQEGRILEKQVRSLEIRNDAFVEIQEKQSLMLNQMIAAETQMLVDEYFKEKRPEQVERMKNSVKMLADLIDKGAEIHPSIGESEKVKNLFPKVDNILSIASKIKELNSGKNDAI